MPTKTDSSCAIYSNQIDSPKISSSLKIEWLDSKEAANYLKLPVKSLLNLTSSGKIPYNKLGRLNRYQKDVLDSVLLQNKRGNYGY